MSHPAVALSEALLAAARAEDPGVGALVARLAAVEPGAIEGSARVAFWLNLYNARVRTAVHELGLKGSLRWHRGFFHATRWVVGGRPVSLHAMEHGILRGNRPAPYTLWRPLSARDPIAAWAVGALDPRVHFALNCGAVSCPPIRAYTAAGLERELEVATRSYLDGEVAVSGGTVTLPYLCKLHRADFGGNPLEFAAAHVDDARAAAIRALGSGAKVRWGEYRWEIVA